MEKLTYTNEELQKKAEELSVQHNVKVHAISFVVPETGEKVYGFLKEPSRATKLMIMDKSMINPVSTTAGILPLCIIREASDRRLWEDSNNPDDDALYMGAVMYLLELVKRSQNQLKKS